MKKLAYLEGLRGVAALIVVFHHFVLLFFPALNYGNGTNTTLNTIAITPLNIFYNGDFAVCLFFVLSGYVLSYKYILTNDPYIILGYAVKRYFRLMPLIASSVLLIFLLSRLDSFHTQKLDDYLHLGDWLTGMFNGDASFVAVLKNIFYGIFFFGDNSYNPVVWSMGIEFIGSMLLFAFLLLNHKIKPKWILFILILLLAIYLKRYYYIAFLQGYGLCYLDQKELFKIKSIILKTVLLIAGIMCASYPADWQHWNTSIYAFMTFNGIDLYSFYHVLGSSIILMLVTQNTISKNFFSLKPVLFLGKISFAMYLFHLIVLILVTQRVFSYLFTGLNYSLCVIIVVAIAMPLILLVSYFAERIIDQPALKLANRIEKWFLGKIKV